MNFEIVGGLTGVIRLDYQPDRLASGKVPGDVQVVRKEEFRRQSRTHVSVRRDPGKNGIKSDSGILFTRVLMPSALAL